MKSIQEFENKIICGDCLEVMKDIPDNSIDMILTSPPYFMGYTFDCYFNSYLQWINFIDNILIDSKRILKSDGIFFLNIQDDKTNQIKSMEVINLAMKYYKVRDIIIWVKTNQQPFNTRFQLTNQYEFIFMLSKTETKELNKENLKKELPDIFENEIISNVWKIPFQPRPKYSYMSKSKITNFKHSHSGFPDKLCKACIILSTNEDDIILDFMCGFGTLPIVAHKLNRRYIGIEINPEYCESAKERIKNIITIKKDCW